MRSKEFRKVMKSEALKRMERLKIYDFVIDAFESSDRLFCSDYEKVREVPPEILKEIQDLEKKNGCLAYHVVFCKLYGCDFYNALSVSNYIEDWSWENSLIEDNRAIAYTINTTIPEYSEFGSIVLDNNRGILQRII